MANPPPSASPLPAEVCRTLGLSDLFSIPWTNHLLGSIGEGLVVADHENRVLYMNPQAEKMLGSAMVRLKGENILKCHKAPWKVEEVLKGYSHDRPFREEVRVGHRWFSITASPLFNPTGEMVGSVMVVSDITARRELDETIQRQNQELMARQSRLDLQMELARTIQKALMPADHLRFNGISTRFWNRQSQVVGGDFALISPDSQGGWLVLGDVMGKGLSAGQFVPLMYGFIYDELRTTLSPQVLLSRLNERLTMFIQERFTLFVTALVVRLESARRRALVASAGHEGLFRLGPAGLEAVSTESSFPLGLQPDPTYHEKELALVPHDTWLLSSDGITELDKRDPGAHPFGWLGRLLEEEAIKQGGPPLDVIATYLQRYPAPDDQTLITFQLDAPAAAPSRATAAPAQPSEQA